MNLRIWIYNICYREDDMSCLNIVPFLCFLLLYVASGFKLWGSCCLYTIIGFTFLVRVVMLRLSHKKYAQLIFTPLRTSVLLCCLCLFAFSSIQFFLCHMSFRLYVHVVMSTMIYEWKKICSVSLYSHVFVGFYLCYLCLLRI